VILRFRFFDDRFKDYDGSMLEEFINLQRQVPEAYYALLKDNMSITDILKVNCAINKLLATWAL